MFDEQPDADPHGECSAEIRKLQGLLREALDVIREARRYGAGDWSGLEGRIDAELQGNGERQPQWRCFHCDAVFTGADEARLHFGASEHSTPACQIDAAALRDLEETLRRYREEDTDLHRALHAKDCQRASAVRRAEEQGYANGLRDAAASARALVDGMEHLLATPERPQADEKLKAALVVAREVAVATVQHSELGLALHALPLGLRARMASSILKPDVDVAVGGGGLVEAMARGLLIAVVATTLMERDR